MSNYLYQFDTEQSSPELIFSKAVGGKYVYLSNRAITGTGGELVGQWAADGSIITQPLPVFEQQIRPTGNTEGQATGNIALYHNFQGEEPARIVQPAPAAGTLPEFPAEQQPVVLAMEHRWDDTAGFEGWGWKATIEFSDPARPPDARAIGIYDADWNYLYTTGAFINESGQWVTYNPPGRATATRADWHYALLLGSAQEGHMILQAGVDSQQNLFWDHDQLVQLVWGDSGSRTDGEAGTVIMVTDISPFNTGQSVRIDGVVAVITSIWNSQGLVLDPFVAHAPGLVIEI